MGAVVIKRTDANETCHSDSFWMLLAGIGWQLAIEAPHVRSLVWRGPLIGAAEKEDGVRRRRSHGRGTLVADRRAQMVLSVHQPHGAMR